MATSACEWRGIQRLDDPRRRGVEQWGDERPTYREWLFGLLDFMWRKGSRPCRMCGKTCRCDNVIITENGGVWLKLSGRAPLRTG